MRIRKNNPPPTPPFHYTSIPKHSSGGLQYMPTTAFFAKENTWEQIRAFLGNVDGTRFTFRDLSTHHITCVLFVSLHVILSRQEEGGKCAGTVFIANKVESRSIRLLIFLSIFGNFVIFPLIITFYPFLFEFHQLLHYPGLLLCRRCLWVTHYIRHSCLLCIISPFHLPSRTQFLFRDPLPINDAR